MTANVLLISTLSTKSEEANFMARHLADHGVNARLMDSSLCNNGAELQPREKTAAMRNTIEKTTKQVLDAIEDVNAVVGLGGGTGAEIILKVMRSLPITFPKVLITTLPFDPRIAVADNSIILVPTLADICGLNATLREVLENAAAMTAGLCQTRRKAGSCVTEPSIGITALGVTEAAAKPLIKALSDQGKETTVFHANGYGGGAFSRFASRGAFHSIIDLTPHELTRMRIAGAHIDMPERFTLGEALPRILLPGGLNFIGLGEASLVPKRYLDRPHYAHSGFFTHVKINEDEMGNLAQELAKSINAAKAPQAVIVPMRGFSHQDAPGGAIEDPSLRQIFLDVMQSEIKSYPVTALDAHISDPLVTKEIVRTLESFET